MTTAKYYSGTEEVQWPHAMKNTQFAEQFPEVVGKRYDSFNRWIGYRVQETGKTLLPVTRIILFKKNPSLHECGPRCRSAKGPSCECSCGGQFHGAN